MRVRISFCVFEAQMYITIYVALCPQSSASLPSKALDFFERKVMKARQDNLRQMYTSPNKPQNKKTATQKKEKTKIKDQ